MAIRKSNTLSDVCFDIRGPVLAQAKLMEEQGAEIIKLNIGNPAAFGFEAKADVLAEVRARIGDAQGYCDAHGIEPALNAVIADFERKGIPGVKRENVFIGNGLSELIQMALQALLNSGDEVLIPAPDFPLWTAAVSVAGGRPVHYLCDESAQWFPDLEHVRRSITDKTKALVLINPNNPTGAVYDREVLEAMLEIAREHNLVVFSDEIYCRILYEDAVHIPTASLADDLVIVTFDGLSKAYLLAGFRAGWMVISGDTEGARDYREGIDMLASMRLCANVPMQFAIPVALEKHGVVEGLTLPGSRLRQQRDVTWAALNDILGVSCTKPQGAIYLFPRLDPEVYPIHDDEQFVLNFLKAERVLLVQGTAFNWPKPDHFRIVFLPRAEDLEIVMERFSRFLCGFAVTV